MASPAEDDDATLARNRYAKIRTELANERTLLSYFRTGLGCAIAGASSIHFLTGRKSFFAGYGLMVLGTCLTLLGFGRFMMARRRLGSVENTIHRSSAGEYGSRLGG